MTADPDSTAPAIQRQEPPKAMLAVANPVFAALLRSPLHRLVDGPFLLLHITGRTTGRRYSIVVARHDLDGGTAILTSSPWRMNARGGADVEITDRGRTRPARAELVEDPDLVADAYASEIQRLGWKAAQRRIALKINVERAPTHDELVDAARREHLSVIRLRPA
jgi:hypothetical protein